MRLLSSPTPDARYLDRLDILDAFPLKAGIAAIGDSHVERAPWHMILGRADVANLGIGGDTTSGVLRRAGSVGASGAERVFILVGINDILAGRSPEAVVQGIAAIVQAVGPGKAVVVSLLPVTGRYARHQQAVDVVNARSREFCPAPCRFLDVSGALGEGGLDPANTRDGLHLNARGYLALARAISPLIGSTSALR